MPVAGAHYPRSTGEFLAWFRTDEDCLDYLEWLRWPDGFICPGCGHAGGWRLGDGRIKCGGCGARASLTAGTIFDKTRTPLTVWFHACWLFATAKDGISALSLQRSLEIGSFSWLHLGVQMLDNGQPVRMSKRAGTFVTLREVVDEVETLECDIVFRSVGDTYTHAIVGAGAVTTIIDGNQLDRVLSVARRTGSATLTSCR